MMYDYNIIWIIIGLLGQHFNGVITVECPSWYETITDSEDNCVCRKQQPIQELGCTDDLGGQLQLGHCMMDCTQLAPALMPISVHVMVLQMMMVTLLYQVIRLSAQFLPVSSIEQDM